MRNFRIKTTLVKDNKIFSSKIKLLWFKSYMAIITILIIVGIFSLGITKNILSNENKIYCDAIIESEKKRTDEKITLAINMAAKLAKDNNIIRFSDFNNSEAIAYEAYKLQNELSSYFLFEDSMSEAYITFNKNNYVVGTMYTGDFSGFKKSMEYKYSEDINKVFESEAYGIDLFKDGIVYKLPIIVNTREVAQIYIFLDTPYMLNGKSQDVMNLYVANNKGDICCLRRSQEKDTEYMELLKNISYADDVIFVKDKVILISESDVGNVHYIFEMQKNRYRKGENQVALVMIIFFMLCAIAGIYFSIKMIEKNYYPIKEILKKLHKNKDLNKHELEMISYAIDEIIKQNKFMFADDKKKTYSLKSSYFANLFKLKNISNEQILDREQLQMIGVDLPYDYFIVCMCYLEDISYYSSSIEETDSKLDYALCNFVLSNVANDIFVGVDNWSICEIDGTVTFIFNVKNEEISDFLIDKLINFENILRGSVNIKTFMGVSDVHRGLEGLSVAYDEIKYCRKKQKGRKKQKECSDGILFYNEVVEIQKHNEHTQASTFYYFPPEQEKRIYECVRTGQEDEMIEIIENVIRINGDNDLYSLYKMKYLAYDLTCMLAKNLDKNYNEILEKKLGINDVFLEIERCVTFEEMKNRIIEIMKCICNENKGIPMENRSVKICKKVKEYIEQNYSDSNLSLVNIASEFSLNDTYLSSTYKKYYSIGLTDYLRYVRIEKAKELLMNGTNTIEQISEKVGYNSSRTFARAFKTVTGVTPKVFVINQKEKQ